jgi:hypothetical protein
MIVQITDETDDFFLDEGYYYLSEDDAEKNKYTHVWECIHQDDIGKMVEIKEQDYVDIVEFVKFVYEPTEYPELYI